MELSDPSPPNPRERHAQTMSDPLKPAVTVLVKLGSIAVHVEEMMSPTGHAFDHAVLEQLLNDTEIRLWLARMDELAMLPLERT